VIGWDGVLEGGGGKTWKLRTYQISSLGHSFLALAWLGLASSTIPHLCFSSSLRERGFLGS